LKLQKNTLYNSYGHWLQQRFGERVHKISVHAGFTCPNRDGTMMTGGCTYCNIASFTPETSRPRHSIRDQVARGIEFIRSRYGVKKFIAYFQPYTNTYAAVADLERMYREALDHPEVIGLAVGTRPDCVNEEILQMLSRVARDYFVALEFGIESIYDDTLRRVNRGHDFACSVEAFRRSRNRGLHLGGHVVIGFPGETKEQWLAMPAAINRLGLDAIKIHHLHVVRGTAMARQFEDERFYVFDIQDWVDTVIKFMERLDPAIVIERLHGEAPQELLIAPHWNLSRAEIRHAIEQEMRRRKTRQGRLAGVTADVTSSPAT
jgi:radical SAM protein (TIGR01212 family)